MTPAARKFFAWLPAVVVAVVVWASLTGRLPGWLFSGSERVQEAELNLYGMLVDSQGRISDEAEALRLIERGNVDPNEPMIGTMAGPAYRFLHLTTSPDNAKRAIELGADVNQRAGRDGPTPLFTAKTAELVKALLDNGADPDITSNGRKAIHINPSLPAIEAMIQHGVDVDSPAANGDTALSVLFQTASFPGSIDSIATWNNMPWRHKRANLLLVNGADVNATNQGGRSVLDLALQVDAKPGPLSHGNTLHQFVAPEDWALAEKGVRNLNSERRRPEQRFLTPFLTPFLSQPVPALSAAHPLPTKNPTKPTPPAFSAQHAYPFMVIRTRGSNRT